MRAGNRLRTKEAARYIGVSYRSLNSRSWRLRHRVPAFRIGRILIFDQEALDRWMASHRERGPRDLTGVVDGSER
jgi:hypothetical protein